MAGSDPFRSLYSSYFRDFFLLRCPVTVNGRHAETIFCKGHSNPLLCCKELSVTLELSPESIMSLLKHGVQRSRGFYYDRAQVLLICVEFPSEDGIRLFLSSKDDFKQAFVSALKVKKQPVHLTPINIDAAVELYLICVSRRISESTLKVHQVTLDSFSGCVRKWKQSKLPEFASDMFENTELLNTDEAYLPDVQMELRGLDEWFSLGDQLGLSIDDLKAIQCKYKTTTECRNQMLVRWQEMEVPLRSKLNKALVAIKRTHITCQHLAKGASGTSTRLNTKDYRQLYSHLREHAVKWWTIGLNLGFSPNELSLIQSKPVLLLQDATGYFGDMLTNWLQWAPGDGRGSTVFATIEALRSALRASELGAAACDLESQFSKEDVVADVSSFTTGGHSNEPLLMSCSLQVSTEDNPQASYDTQSSEMSRKVTELTKEKHQRRSLNEQIDKVRSDSVQQEQKIRDLNQKVDNLNKRLKVKSVEIDLLQENVDMVESFQLALEAELAKKQIELCEAKEELLNIDKRYCNATDQLEIKTEEVNQLEIEVNKLKLQLETEYEEVQRQETAVSVDPESEVKSIELKLHVLRGETESRNREVEACKQELKKQQQQIATVKSAREEKQNELEVAEKEMEKESYSPMNPKSTSLLLKVLNLRMETYDLKGEEYSAKSKENQAKIKMEVATAKLEQYQQRMKQYQESLLEEKQHKKSPELKKKMKQETLSTTDSETAGEEFTTEVLEQKAANFASLIPEPTSVNQHTCVLVIGSAAHGKSTTADKLLIACTDEEWLCSDTTPQLCLDSFLAWCIGGSETSFEEIRMRLKNLSFFRSQHEDLCQEYNSRRHDLRSTPGCVVISNNQTGLCVVDVCSVNIDDAIMKQVMYVQASFNIKFQHVLYFLPCRGPLERRNDTLSSDLKCLYNYYGPAIFKSMVLVATVSPRFSVLPIDSAKMFDREDIQQTSQVFMEVLTELFGNKFNVAEVTCPPIIFLSLKHSCEYVLNKVITSKRDESVKLAIPTSHNANCRKCGIKVVLSENQERVACITEPDNLLLPYEETCCHPEIGKKFSVLAKMFLTMTPSNTADPNEEMCSFCERPPYMNGCKKVGSLYDTKKARAQVVDHVLL